MPYPHQININRLSKFFHCQNQEKMYINAVSSHHTSNVSLHYLVSCKSTTTQRFVDRAIAQWRRRVECVVQQQGGHIEHVM